MLHGEDADQINMEDVSPHNVARRHDSNGMTTARNAEVSSSAGDPSSPSTTHPLQSIDMRRVIATFTGLLGVFFFFWSVRLFIVTGFLQHLRPGGGGAYVGAVVFPLLAIAFGWITTRLWRRAE